MLDVVIVSSVSKDSSIVLGRKIADLKKNCKVHILYGLKTEADIYEKVKNNCNNDILYLDEFCEITEDFLKKADSIDKTSLLEFEVNEDVFLKMGVLFKKEDMDRLTIIDFFSVILGDQDTVDTMGFEVIEGVGKYNPSSGGSWSYFLGNRMKYFISRYGDKQDIDDLNAIMKNGYFEKSDYKKLKSYDPFDEGLVEIISGSLNTGSTDITKEGSICAGKGLIIVFASDLDDCFGIRRFAKSIYSQTYSNYEIICFGSPKDVKEMSNYILDSVMFKVWDETQYSFINKKIKENKYEWYFIADPYCEYDKKTIELCMLQNKKAVFFCSEPYDIETMKPCGLPAVDSMSMFFKKDIFEDLGYFDPINKFGALEYLNRVGSLKYGDYTVLPLVLSKNINIILNFSIDKFRTQREKYFDAMNSGYEVGPGYSGRSFLMNCPLSLRKSKFDVEPGNVNVKKIFLRTLGSEDRLDHMKKQIRLFGMENVEIWKNTHKTESVIEDIFTNNEKLSKSCYRCAKEDCQHIREEGLKSITRGQIANFYSTMKLFEKISESDSEGQDLFMVCEDDVVFSTNFVTQLNKMLSKKEIKDNLDEPILLKIGWGDMLEYRRDHYIESSENYELVENKKRFSNPVFVINKHAAKFYVDNFEKYDRACDQWVHVDMGMKIKNYAIFPALAKELSHVGLISSDMHPKASHYEWQQLQYLKTGNIEHLNRAIELKKEYDDFWGYKDEENEA